MPATGPAYGRRVIWNREEGIPLRRRVQFASALLVLVTVVAQAGVVFAEPVGGSYIVVFEDEAVGRPTQASQTAGGTFPVVSGQPRALPSIDRAKVSRRVNDVAASLRVKPKHVYDSAVGGFAANLSAAQLRQVRNDPAVAFVMPDAQVSLDDGLVGDGGVAGIRITTSDSPRMPAGIVRVGATKNPIAGIAGDGGRVDADIAILDTGVDPNHPDLNVAGGYNCTGSNRGAWGDQHGHGTHVAGTAAALDNGIGVVGVAPGARIWSVKVLNERGTGYLSWLVCGIDWVTAQKDKSVPSGQLIEVANMSLRFGLPNADNRDCGVPAGDAVHRAICRSVQAGVLYAVAAGNDERNARYYRPAAYPSVVTVSAIVDYDGKPGGLARQADYCPFYSADADDTFANFSNFGAVIDLTAPGKCVVSTYPGARYAWMSGTSMATPHVAGGAALYMVRYPAARPQQVKMALQHAGTLDWRTSTDPDNRHEKLLWLGSYGPPPTFDIDGTSVPSGWLGQGSRVSVGVSRSHGHNAPVSLSLRDAPAGLTGTGTISGSNGSLTLHVQPGTDSGMHRVTLRASDGELVSTRKIDVRIDGSPPNVQFRSPSAGLTVQSSTNVLVSWTESDAGSGIYGRTLQRQRGEVRIPGTCDSVSYTDVGSAETRHDDYNQSLKRGYCFRWQLTVRDVAGNRTTVTSGAVLVDDGGNESLGGPSVSRPTTALLPGAKVTPSGLVRVDVNWSANSSAASVTSHQLRVSRDGSESWTDVTLPDSDEPRAVLKLPAGSYFVSARARDSQGVWSGWVSSAQFTVSLAQAESSAVTYRGDWSTSSIAKTLGGKVRHSAQAGARATFTFTGRQVALVALTGPNRGKADVYVNGNLRATIDLRTASLDKRRIVFSRRWDTSAKRTIEVRLHGAGSGARVDLDAFVVLR
ncbi:MAG TPA: S8 family serine peptidase [Candidatus Limnocylindria bacterium]|nr:S8 family serine peptidase [Candidatus Limnocylindria bacterium]